MRIRELALVCGLALSLTGTGQAQAFEAGTTYIGPSISLATYGSTIAFGGHVERAVTDKWGWAVSVGYFSFTEGIKVTYIPITALATYHFEVTNPKLDPFVGAGLGYFSVSCSSCGDAYSSLYSSGLFPAFTAGARYWTTENLALVARAGYGLGFLSIGVDFKL